MLLMGQLCVLHRLMTQHWNDVILSSRSAGCFLFVMAHEMGTAACRCFEVSVFSKPSGTSDDIVILSEVKKP